MRVSVMVFKVVLIDNGEKGCDDTHNSSAVNVKAGACILQPYFFLSEVGRAICLQVCQCAHQGGDKRSNNKKVTKVTDEIMDH